MKKITRMIFAVAVVLLLHAQLMFAAAPEITADAAIVIDSATGEAVYEKNADEIGYPASMTKMLTCIIGLEKGVPDSVVCISPTAADVETTRLWAGKQLYFQDLLKQMMLISDNGAALAVGEAIAGSQEDFAELMNQKAAEIGAVNSHFVNPNGMPDDEHYSTARDMAKIAAYGMKNAKFRELVSSPVETLYYLEPQGYVEYCENTNVLLQTYPGCNGIKTGYTRAAMWCLTASAQRGDREYIAVIMHAQSDESRYQDAAVLLDYAFARE